MFNFEQRHIGISPEEKKQMLEKIGLDSLDTLMDETIPADIKRESEMDVPPALSEYEYHRMLKGMASKNKIYRSYIGQGYNGTITPAVISRNIFQNPGWYTQYTPYQAEIAQGRLEALLNFQTMVSDLTGLPIANASLLDEATSAAEAMSMFFAVKNKRNKKDPIKKFFVDNDVYDHTVAVLDTRALPLGIEIVRGDWDKVEITEEYFGVLVQFPSASGAVQDYKNYFESLNEKGVYITVAADLLSLALFVAPGEIGAHAVVGNTQRFGVPLGYGGPHAAYFATLEDFKRVIPGRIIGVSVDSQGKRALRMALQTREQHIRREKATSNICTAQALLAIMAGMYAVYHGPQGIKSIASSIQQKAEKLRSALADAGYDVVNQHIFDTIAVRADKETSASIRSKSEEKEINFYYSDTGFSIALDETVSDNDLNDLAEIFGVSLKVGKVNNPVPRNTDYLTHSVFSSYHTESKMMRYIKSLENKDLSLMHSMIALGSCTMKLNAAAELMPVSWSEFADIHPFAPLNQVEGYIQMIEELSAYLSDITGFTACSLQPNSGAQGEYAGLLTIVAYHKDNNGAHRDKVLIPTSAHGTNPASAVMAGMKVVLVKCDEEGNIDFNDLKEKSELHKDTLAGLMVTYPSTHGVFEAKIKDICDTVHANGGLVYMDGANMNAQVGLTSPGHIHADVCHLNLHKTFAIPHGGGGPGMGPICVNDKLAPYLPGHHVLRNLDGKRAGAVSAAPFGSASILLISYGYIRMLGAEGMLNSTKYAILNANYMKARLEEKYDILYTGEKGRAAHELIVDLRKFKALDVSAEDLAKRLIDYGFHSPTLSFPVAGTLMIEPTESEDKNELDRFCDAMLAIHDEIDEIAAGTADKENNVLHNAPHCLELITADKWDLPYSREKAAYPISYLRNGNKFWASVGRVDNAHGDRNLICTCPPIEEYAEDAI